MTGRFEHFDARSGGSYRVPGVALPDARINATSLAVHVSSGIRVPIEADAPDIRWTNYNTSDLVRLVETRTRSGMRMPSSPELIARIAGVVCRKAASAPTCCRSVRSALRCRDVPAAVESLHDTTGGGVDVRPIHLAKGSGRPWSSGKAAAGRPYPFGPWA
jgi:hypothetical protein